jgi:hypothetical protein
MQRVKTSALSRLVLAILALSVLSMAAPAGAQQPALTWIRYFNLPSNSRTDLTRTARVPFDKLLTDRTITTWGILEPVSRIGEPWTHAIYVSAPGWGAIDAVTAALDAAGPTRNERTHDVVLRHLVQSETPAISKPKFMVMNLHPIIRGRHVDAVALYNEWQKPVFTKLAEGGKVGPWGLSMQSVVLDKQWTYMSWYFTADTAALEDIHTALGTAGTSQLQTFERRLRAMSEDDYIGQLLRVVYSAQ